MTSGGTSGTRKHFRHAESADSCEPDAIPRAGGASRRLGDAGLRPGRLRRYFFGSAAARSAIRSLASSMPTDSRTSDSDTSSGVPLTDAWVISLG